ncbi:MFS transporter [Dictyobacter formicarum]|uniref:MFS transporter n=1 Tax=Dictyobacter formicarum TaxID=2778368 RepID=A0ABQ3VI38_9CHLR|nr:MFS transporter [Dictyobacter formicarum]GHO85842.1 MFS transporter [Dictyobacter formicarum]
MRFSGRLSPSRHVLAIASIRWLLLSRLCADLFFYSTTIVRFQQERGLNFTAMFVMESFLSASIWLADLPTSIWADRFGYRRMIILGHFCSLLGLLCFLFAHGFWWFALSNVIGGLAIACTSGCEGALLYQSLPAERRETLGGAAFTLLRLASTCGFFLGLLPSSWIGAYSPALAVALSLIPTLCSLLAAWRVQEPSTQAATADQDHHATPVRTSMLEIIKLALKTIRQQPALVSMKIFSSATFALVNAVFWYNQPYFSRAGLPVAWFGPAMALALACQFLVLFRLPWLQQRISTRILLAISCGVPGLAYILLVLAHQPLLAILLIACIVAFSVWQDPLINHQLNQRIPDQSRATTLSGLSLIGSLTATWLNPWIGLLGDQGLNITGPGLGASLLLLAALIPLLIQRNKKNDP